MVKIKYLSTSLSMYINYFVHGMALIILAQNMDFLANQWSTDTAGVARVVSSFGLGKIISVFVTGRMSDKYGRKISVSMGMLFYLVFLIGILFSKDTTLAYAFGICAGIANSFLDTGTYPALMEAYPKKTGPANIVVKFFVQAGQFLLPYFIGFLVLKNMWYGWSFVILAVILCVNLIFVMTRTFPLMESSSASKGVKQSVASEKRKVEFNVAEVSLILYGFVAMGLLHILGQWISKYGSDVVGMSTISARHLVSYASIGALVCVVTTFILGNRGVRSQKFLLLYTFMTMIVSLTLWKVHAPVVSIVCAVLLGFFSSGGLIQLGLTLLVEKSKRGKGLVTSYYTIAEGIALFVIPFATAKISLTNISNIFLLNAMIALFGIILILLATKKTHGDATGL